MSVLLRTNARDLHSGVKVEPWQEQYPLPRVKASLPRNLAHYANNHASNAVHSDHEIHDRSTKKTVLLVGAGIMNLVAAEYLAVQGFQVRIVDANPDPRTCKDWMRLGVTHGGGDARMWTPTEADSYNESHSTIYSSMQRVFRKTTLNGGWSVKQPSTFSDVEMAWVDAFEQLPTELAQTIKRDIYSVNQEAGKLWDEFMARVPELFEGVSLHNDILRLYADEAALNGARELNRKLEAVIDDLPQSKLLEKYPWMRSAAESNHLAGGFIVQGFTLSIHSFVKNLIDRIIELGGEFTWNCRVEKIQRQPSGAVALLESQLGDLKADNYVISTGVTRNGLLDGTASANLIQGVLGVWLQIPNVAPMLKHSIKFRRRGFLAEDINVTVSKDARTNEDILVLGSGYGYVGLGHPCPKSAEMQAIWNELEEVARIYFPEGYRLGKEQGTFYPEGQKFCIRPFTCTGLGVFEDIPTESGGHLIITGGNNTGGFAQSPAIARAVHRAMIGEHDPIHTLFDPCRSKLVVEKSTLIG